MERARQALAHIEAAWEDDDAPLPSDFQAIRDLLAEIDAGVWIDTRELEALRVEHGLVVAATAITSHGRWIVYDVNDDCAPGVFYATAADAVRAAREADRG